MSYLLDFPTGSLPRHIRSPPYVVFAIRGQDIVADLPPRVPLNVVLHFAPKLKQWVLPPPSITSLPRSVARVALRTPYIGVDILSDNIDVLGLGWILCRMLQASGLAHPISLFRAYPTILVSVSIYKTWLALDLPVAGIQNLHTHIQTRLMLGPAVTLLEIMAIWKDFPHTSEIVRAMGLNFIRSHIDLDYSHREFSAIRDWYLQSAERCRFFKSLEDQFPAFGEAQDKVFEVAAQKLATSNAKKTIAGKRAEETAERIKKLMEKTGTRKVSPEERKERQAKDGAAMQTRLRRTKSDESLRSVETVIWDPPTQSETDQAAAEWARADEEQLMNKGAFLKRDRFSTLRRKAGREELEAERKLQKLKQTSSKTLTEAIKHEDNGEFADDERKEEAKRDQKSSKVFQPTFQPAKGKKRSVFIERRP